MTFIDRLSENEVFDPNQTAQWICSLKDFDRVMLARSFDMIAMNWLSPTQISKLTEGLFQREGRQSYTYK